MNIIDERSSQVRADDLERLSQYEKQLEEEIEEYQVQDGYLIHLRFRLIQVKDEIFKTKNNLVLGVL